MVVSWPHWKKLNSSSSFPYQSYKLTEDNNRYKMRWNDPHYKQSTLNKSVLLQFFPGPKKALLKKVAALCCLCFSEKCLVEMNERKECSGLVWFRVWNRGPAKLDGQILIQLFTLTIGYVWSHRISMMQS